MKQELTDAVFEALVALGLFETVSDVPSGVSVERPANPDHGDWSTNAAMVCAKAAGRNPRELGQQLLDHLEANRPPHVEVLEIAGPGFVNFRLAPSWLHDVLTQIIGAGEGNYARLNIGEGTSINVEFVSANPTGPLHAGGGRWGAFGDSLSRILTRCGFETHKEYYINDRGVQTVLFGQSLLARKRGEDVPEGGYQGEYINQWAQEMPVDADPTVWGLERSLAEVRTALESMHVSFDTWSSEKALVESGAMDEVMAELTAGGHVFKEDQATWLRTTAFPEAGDDKDRVLIRSDGEPTYLLPDIAYHRDKFNRGHIVLDILGADHHGYVPRMKASMQALGYGPDRYQAIIGQNVKLKRDGQEIKMSKRAGSIVTIDELVDEVGPDVARFAYLLQSVDTSQTIDIDILKKEAGENPVFYVQYAHARIHRLSDEAVNRGIERQPFAAANLAVLTHEKEIDLLKQLQILPEVLALACSDRAPHKVTTWVRELAAAFHGFYHQCPILRSDIEPEVQQARMWLTEATRVGLAIGLDLLGVDAPEQM